MEVDRPLVDLDPTSDPLASDDTPLVARPWPDADDDDHDESDRLLDLDDDSSGLDHERSEAARVPLPASFAPREDEEFCEVSPPPSKYRSEWRRPHRHSESQNGVFYPPERQPPVMDFLTMITAFLVAVFAAYYSISV